MKVFNFFISISVLFLALIVSAQRPHEKNELRKEKLAIFYVDVKSTYFETKTGHLIKIFNGSGIIFKDSILQNTFVLAPSHLVLGSDLQITISEFSLSLPMIKKKCLGLLDLCLVQVAIPEDIPVAEYDIVSNRFSLPQDFTQSLSANEWEILNLNRRYFAVDVLKTNGILNFSSVDEKSMLIVPKKFNSAILQNSSLPALSNPDFKYSSNIFSTLGFRSGWSGAVVLSLNSKLQSFSSFEIEQVLTTFNLNTHQSMGPNKTEIQRFLTDGIYSEQFGNDVAWFLENQKLVAYKKIVLEDQVQLYKYFRPQDEIPIGNGIIADGRKPVLTNK